jgi:hypothetical protein
MPLRVSVRLYPHPRTRNPICLVLAMEYHQDCVSCSTISTISGWCFVGNRWWATSISESGLIIWSHLRLENSEVIRSIVAGLWMPWHCVGHISFNAVTLFVHSLVSDYDCGYEQLRKCVSAFSSGQCSFNVSSHLNTPCLGGMGKIGKVQTRFNTILRSLLGWSIYSGGSSCSQSA